MPLDSSSCSNDDKMEQLLEIVRGQNMGSEFRALEMLQNFNEGDDYDELLESVNHLGDKFNWTQEERVKAVKMKLRGMANFTKLWRMSQKQ